MQIICEEDGTIDCENGLTTHKPIPKSLAQLKTVATPSACRSVCFYKGDTYVGLDDYSIARVGENGQITISVVRFGNYVDSIAVYNDRIYTLVYGRPFVVHVHDLAGNPVKQWNHTDNGGAGTGNQLAIISDQVVVPDRSSSRITIYSLDGETVRQIPCSQLANRAIAMCDGGDNSIIISDYGACHVFRVSLADGRVMWTAPNITYAQGVALYRKKYVCVVNPQNQPMMWILCIKTGWYNSLSTSSILV